MTTPVRFCQVAIKWMIERKRRVVINVASTTLIAKMGIIYARSKAGLVMFSEMLKHMCNVKDIHIQALCQGFEHIEFLRHEGKNLQKIQTIAPHWMTAEELVKLSLENVKSRHVVFVLGEENQNLMKMIRQSYLKKYLDLKIL